MTRAEWLASLKVGDHVRLITPCGNHPATVENFKGHRLWVLWAMEKNCDMGYSAIWVDAITGDNDGHSYRIEPTGD